MLRERILQNHGTWAMESVGRIAVEAWEALFRASATIERDLRAGDAWGELAGPEYGVLYELTKAPDGVRITDLGEDVLLTQAGISRLAGRLVEKGLVERVPDPEDGRATRLVLTTAGADAQRRIGRIHAREILTAMSERLSPDELQQMTRLCAKLIGAGDDEQGDAGHPPSPTG
ncbi:MarR family winged helix-turn-helix transcriptional regulator [uncultured Microbacterium sp.]|uniref:MarR family winged helix-turn-helix transcriptional regulator n=1 Tax=uncultured Microbacterium sp. TaxID=191216 RepID=UPI0035CB0989